MREHGPVREHMPGHLKRQQACVWGSSHGKHGHTRNGHVQWRQRRAAACAGRCPLPCRRRCCCLTPFAASGACGAAGRRRVSPHGAEGAGLLASEGKQRGSPSALTLNQTLLPHEHTRPHSCQEQRITAAPDSRLQPGESAGDGRRTHGRHPAARCLGFENFSRAPPPHAQDRHPAHGHG